MTYAPIYAIHAFYVDYLVKPFYREDTFEDLVAVEDDLTWDHVMFESDDESTEFSDKE